MNSQSPIIPDAVDKPPTTTSAVDVKSVMYVPPEVLSHPSSEYGPLIPEGNFSGDDDDENAGRTLKEKIIITMLVFFSIALTCCLASFGMALRKQSLHKRATHVAAKSSSFKHDPSFIHFAATPTDAAKSVGSSYAKDNVSLVCKCIVITHIFHHDGLPPSNTRTTFQLSLKGSDMSTLRKECNERCAAIKKEQIEANLDTHIEPLRNEKLHEIQHPALENIHGEESKKRDLETLRQIVKHDGQSLSNHKKWFSHRAIVIPMQLLSSPSMMQRARNLHSPLKQRPIRRYPTTIKQIHSSPNTVAANQYVGHPMKIAPISEGPMAAMHHNNQHDINDSLRTSDANHEIPVAGHRPPRYIIHHGRPEAVPRS